MLQVDHYLPLFGRDFLAATAGWTAEERGHYITLLIVQWEQGALPNGFDRLERVSPGVSAVWEILEPKFPEWDDGLRRNRRLEEHRAKAQELKNARSEAGRRGSDARWGGNRMPTGSEPHGKPMAKAIANGMANGMAKTCPPSPSPSPPVEEQKQYARAGGETPISETKAAEGGKPAPAVIREPGWVHDEWARIVASWNATERAVPWTLATPPNGFADLAASPGWVQTALAGIGMLADCRRFARPVPWTQFVRDLDRIIAGEFREPLAERRELAAAGGRGQRRGNL